MRKRRVYLIVVVVAGAALAATFVTVLLRPSGDTAQPRVVDGRVTLVEAGRRTPLPDAGGPALTPPPANIRLRALAGRPAFIDVWAAWCVPCREEAPVLARLWRQHRGEVRFLGIDVEDTRARLVGKQKEATLRAGLAALAREAKGRQRGGSIRAGALKSE